MPRLKAEAFVKIASVDALSKNQAKSSSASLPPRMTGRSLSAGVGTAIALSRTWASLEPVAASSRAVSGWENAISSKSSTPPESPSASTINSEYPFHSSVSNTAPLELIKCLLFLPIKSSSAFIRACRALVCRCSGEYKDCRQRSTLSVSSRASNPEGGITVVAAAAPGKSNQGFFEMEAAKMA